MIKIEVQSTQAVVRYQEQLTVGLRGAKAHFVFGDGWDGLVKTAVFRQGDKTVAVADIDAEVTVPWEVLTQPGLPVQIGVYGTNGSQVAIPTLWAVTQPVRPGTDPEADPSTEPTPGLWEQMQGKLDNLEASVNEASRAVKVTITQNADGSYTADRYCEELLDAHNAGYTVYCQYGSRVFPLLLAARSQVAFGCVYADQTHTVMIGRQSASVVSKTLAAGDGITPHIGANGNWFIGETDTGMPSRGEDAPQEAILYTPQALTHEQQSQARQNIGAIEAPETAEAGQTIVVKEVDENGKPTAWEAADFPAGGGNECDLLLDVTTTERVKTIIQDIEPRAYKQIVALVIASGHSDNSTAGHHVYLRVTNADGDVAIVDTQVVVAQATTIYYSRALMDLSPKYAYCTSTSNINANNSEGIGGAHKGERLYQWDTNVINNIMIDAVIHTMEVGAQIKVWGYRA